ncbi:hypothetical protein HHI36_000951 [Cryptolaemus montrouzieri]|uniref:Uncharacterized protein n=1 Tax=Cryptolaemus montrouzieri TaxID=559131 RepID=A0ABD2P606_9CUCU
MEKKYEEEISQYKNLIDKLYQGSKDRDNAHHVFSNGLTVAKNSQTEDIPEQIENQQEEPYMKTFEGSMMLMKDEMNGLISENEISRAKLEKSEMEKEHLQCRIDSLENQRNRLVNTLETVTVSEEEFEELKQMQREQEEKLKQANYIENEANGENRLKVLEETEKIRDTDEGNGRKKKVLGNRKARRYLGKSELKKSGQNVASNSDIVADEETTDNWVVDECCSDPSEKNWKSLEKEYRGIQIRGR